MSMGQLVGTLVGLLVTAVFIGLIVWGLRRTWRNRNAEYEELDPYFLGAPLAKAVVVERKNMWREVRLRRKYRITYRVGGADGRQFTGWEVIWLGRDGKQKHFRKGAQHLVAHWPGVTDQVRALPPSQNPGWHQVAPRR